MNLNGKLALGSGEKWRGGSRGRSACQQPDVMSEAARQGRGSIKDHMEGGHKEEGA